MPTAPAVTEVFIRKNKKLRHKEGFMDGARTISRSYSERLDALRIKLAIIKFLKELVQSAKGNLVTFRPSKVVQELHIYDSHDMRTKTVMIRAFLDELVQRGYITVIKRSARGKVYGLYRNNRFWSVLLSREPEGVLETLNMEEARR